MLILISVIAVLAIAIIVFLQQPSFGKLPSGERMERIKKSPNYRNGKFQNRSKTPQLTGDSSFFKIAVDFIFGDNKGVSPEDIIPSVKTDLLNLNRDEDILVWLGHSSYFIQIDGKRILVDPVLSGAAAPVSFINKPFKGSDIYKPEDIPDVDYLIITHDHWDHLDYKTVTKLKDRVNKVVCSLGVGAHFEHWKFDRNQIIELDWSENYQSEDGFTLYCLPARHFSGRGLSRDQSLWASFLVKTPTSQIFVGGDGGYDTHFAQIGKQFGGIDLAILENGQYDARWKYIHMMPEEVIRAGIDLNAKSILPLHSAKYAMAHHQWNDPLIRVSEAATKEGYKRVLTPIIGEVVNLKDSTQVFKEWWTDMK